MSITDLSVSFPPFEPLSGEISLPASKSISNRALIITALAGGDFSTLENIAECDDTDVMVAALKSKSRKVNIGAAGTAMRFLTGYYAATTGAHVVIDGSQRMRNRPIAVLVDALRDCGADISYSSSVGYPPLAIKGHALTAPAVLPLNSGISSQYISSLLMVAPYMENGLTMRLEGDVKSLPYIDMTLALMRKFGADATRSDNMVYVKRGAYKPIPFQVESDWSAASYWYEIAALRPGSHFVLKGLHPDSLQGDSKVAEYFTLFGVTTKYREDGVEICSVGEHENEINIDLTEQPDLAQTIVVTAALLGMKFRITGLATLRIKETDRIAALCNELAKLDVPLKVVGDDEICCDGNYKIANSRFIEFDTYKDHRMAMALAPVSLVTTCVITVRDAAVVSKSYPKFWNHLESVGVKLLSHIRSI